MSKIDIMTKSGKKGIILATVMLFSGFLLLIPTSAHAEEITVKSIGLDETTIITLTNESVKEVKSFRIWLGENFNFESFKTEKGWIGEKNSQGVIIFTSSEAIKIGESVKFGIKTDHVNPIINWKGLDKNNIAIETGLVLQDKIEEVDQNPDIESYQDFKNEGTGIFSESSFRIIPNNPNVGSTIRIVGDQFGAIQKFDFYVNTEKLGEFTSDSEGQFITTMQIPKNLQNQRVDFKIKSYDGLEKKMSLRLGVETNRISESENIKLTVNGIEKKIYRGDVLNLFGNGNPGKAITIKIIDSNQDMINTRTTEVSNTGNWELLEPISIPFDAQFGKYSVVVSDGKNQVLKYWEVKTNKVIIINPGKIMYEAGDLIKFNGTVIPNVPLELILEDPLGNELFAETIQIDDSGFMNFEYQTIENDDHEGTWVLVASQKDNTEFVYVGYDVYPTIPVNLKFDKANYQSVETAAITIIGKPSDIVRVIIIGPSGNIQESEKEIQLEEDGRGKYNLSLSGYGSGIYTAVIKKANSQNTETFSVGLQIGSGTINVNTTKLDYRQGEKILVLGQTNPNVLLNIVLADPNDNIIRELQIPSDSVGSFSEDRLRVPIGGSVGTWKIIISSGTNQNTSEFEVLSNLVNEMKVEIEENIKIPGFGQTFKIDIQASHKTSIIIEILDNKSEVVDKLNCNTTAEFRCEVLWNVTTEVLPGTYTVKAYDRISSDQVEFDIIPN
ncbi:biofilm-associated protein [Nitrosopumilus sp.]|jgi:hypothetical protein|nr:biofilm-associated protein [Nitrosopumilus sp.]